MSILKYLEEIYERSTMDKGFSYYKMGKVLELDYNEQINKYEGKVLGSYGTYNTNIKTLKDNDAEIASGMCSCMAFERYGECKHIVALAHKIENTHLDESSLIDQETLFEKIMELNDAIFLKILSKRLKGIVGNNLGDAKLVLQSFLRKGLDITTQLSPNYMDYLDLGGDKNNSGLLNNLFDYKERFDSQTNYKLKLDFSLSDYDDNNIYMDLYECKLLENNKYSKGKLLGKSIHSFPMKYKDLLIFQGSRKGEIWNRNGFNEMGELFITKLRNFENIYDSSNDNEIFVKDGIGDLQLTVMPKNDKFSVGICGMFFEEKVFLNSPSNFFGSGDLGYYAIYQENKLYFFKSKIPYNIIKKILISNINVEKKDLEELIKNDKGIFLSNLGYYEGIELDIEKIHPKYQIKLQISNDLKMVICEFELDYGIGNEMKINDLRPIIKDLDGKLYERDFILEKSVLKELLIKLNFDNYNEKKGIGTKYADENIDSFFTQIQDLTKEGIQIKYLQPAKKITKKSISGKVNIHTNIDWFDTNVEIKLGDEIISDYSKIFDAIKSGSEHIYLDDGTIVKLEKDLKDFVNNLKNIGINEKNIGKNPKIGKYNVGLLDWQGEEKFDYELDQEIIELKKNLLNFPGIKEYPTPKNLKATLRDYQKQGYNWLKFLQDYNFSGILADDMGLGKTIQSIVLLLNIYGENKEKTPSLVVCPKSLTHNWQQEILRFAPSLKTQIINTGKYGLNEINPDTQVIIVSYGIINNLIQEGLNMYFHYIILDEAQNIKNSNTKRAKGIYQLESKYRLALSGTPIENSLFELWSIFNFLMPGFLGTEKEFVNKYIKDGNENIQTLSQKIKPFVLRRLKSQVAKDLPEKIEENIYLTMSEKQAKLYETLKAYYKKDILEKIDNEGLNKSRFHVLDALLKLRQTCLTPALVKIQGNNTKESVKLDYIQENIKEMLSNGHNLIIFSQFTSFLVYIKEILDNENIDYNYLDGQTKDRQILVDNFNEGKVRVFLISLKAGGTGLNLVAADYVILLDPWWNPAVENQAVDRAHRIGQTKTVFVQKLIVKDTIEEKILQLQESKKKLIDNIFEGNFTGKIDEEDIKYIFE
ncbi:MAG: DEAD/DEAH box helicase [Candidatus Absconditabacteria bacterium]